MTRTLLTVILAMAMGCASPPGSRAHDVASPATQAPVPRVAPLRYHGPDPVAASLDAPLRTSGPGVAEEAPLPRPELRTFRLRNGLSVVLLERHSFPMIVTRLAVDLSDIDGQDVGGLEASLLGSVLLAPRHAFGASASCGYSCVLASWGPSDAGEAIFARVSNMLTQAPEPRIEYDRSLAATQASIRTQWSFAEGVSRAEASLLFGHTHRYGYAPMTRTLTIDDLLLMHAQAMDPRKATLFVVGDISGDEALRLATAGICGRCTWGMRCSWTRKRSS